MNFPRLTKSFGLHFGEMGSRRGLNRTVGQIDPLPHVSPEPLCAAGSVGAFGISRSNVSVSLRELQGWSLVVLKPLETECLVNLLSRGTKVCPRRKVEGAKAGTARDDAARFSVPESGSD